MNNQLTQIQECVKILQQLNSRIEYYLEEIELNWDEE